MPDLKTNHAGVKPAGIFHKVLLVFLTVTVLLSLSTYYTSLSQYSTADQGFTYSRILTVLFEGGIGVDYNGHITYALVGHPGFVLYKLFSRFYSIGDRLPGGLHLSVGRSGANYVAWLSDADPVNRHRPSVETLFLSAASVVGPNALGVMLTGMGSDGATATKVMRDAGAWNLAQDEASCVVFGMPKAAIASGAVHEVLPLAQIAPRLLERLRSTAGRATSRV